MAVPKQITEPPHYKGWLIGQQEPRSEHSGIEMSVQATGKAIKRAVGTAARLGGLRRQPRCGSCGGPAPCPIHYRKIPKPRAPAPPDSAADDPAAAVTTGKRCPTCGCYARLDNGDCVACSARAAKGVQ